MSSASPSGTRVMSGGSSTIRRLPATSSVKRGSARSLVRWRARLAARAISWRRGSGLSAAR